ncbi:site-specific integrase [Streptomyces sp. NPDC095602]|uniref:tyrosine-type recombinase/integrase n=1 Tax=Streptomyces sp. NPDC095602 TaxID=3155819 RepID=UPI00331E2A27
MASIRRREKRDGTATFQVRWLEGGRGGSWETEIFGDEDSAADFKKLVEAHGNKWPYGWVKGKGFVEPDDDPDDPPLLEFAARYIDRLTGIDDRTREDYHREVRNRFTHLEHVRADGRVYPATVGNITPGDVMDWVRREESGLRDPDDPERWLRRPADPKSIRNRHGLLFCIMQAAVDGEPQLRSRNPCKGTRLPRVDNHTVEEMTFLEKDEYQRIAAEMKDPAARDLTDWLVGTGMRWGEATALQVRDVSLSGEVPTVNVQRAWKRAPKGVKPAYYLGPPKTKKGRRVVALSPAQADMVRRWVKGQPPEAFLFRPEGGGAWHHGNFYNRKWKPAVAAAVEKGLLKRPRIHDLRHTHVAWLIAARIPLPAIQARLGHESIQTTVDRYGHLVRDLDNEIAAAVEAAMGVPAPRAGLRAVG